MMKPRYFLFALAAGMGGLLGMWGVRRARMLPLPWSAWLPLLENQHGKTIGRRLLAEAMANSHILTAEADRALMRPPLRTHLVGNIIPGLAMYRVLMSESGGDHQAALAEIEPLFHAWTQALYGTMMKMVGVLPRPFWFFRKGSVARLKGFPAETWKTIWHENNAKRISFDNFACIYLSTLTAYGAPELTPYYCQIDDWMADMLPPGIAFRRSQTLARGGDRCDFCYERIENK